MSNLTKTTRKPVTEEDFNQIKVLLNAGVNPKAVAQITKRSYSTVTRINSSEDHKAYVEYIRESARRHYEKVGNKVSSKSEKVQVESTQTEENQPQRTYFDQDSANLERIASALERLAEAWEAQPKRTGLFK